jgi:hypothetical protein
MPPGYSSFMNRPRTLLLAFAALFLTRAAAEHRLKTATNTASEERQTRNDDMLILKLTAPKQRRPYRCRWGRRIAPTRALFDTISLSLC